MDQFNFKNWLFESFDSVSEFLLNPEHKEKDWPQLIDEFEASGGKILGRGRYGSVFSHPSWPYVLKMYSDPQYTAFVRFAYKHPHSAFPKFYGLPQKVVPFYKRFKNQATTYLVRTEKLEPIDRATFKLIEFYYDRAYSYFHSKENGTLDRDIYFRVPDEDQITYVQSVRQARKLGQPEPAPPTPKEINSHQNFLDIIKQHPNLLPLFEGMYILLKSNLKGTKDIQQSNFMKRKDGSLVFTDPFWEGANPYSDALMLRRLETDDGGYDGEFDLEPDLIGGKLPKRKRKKKRIFVPEYRRKKTPSDDVPF